jgi:hypothetical protein
MLKVAFRHSANGRKKSKPASILFICKMQNMSTKPERRSMLCAEASNLAQATLRTLIMEYLIRNLERKSHYPN